ncbi:MAG: menaquinone biosynthesis protein [Saprospiraceae bacterium]
MLKPSYSIALVNYLNAKPFLYGLHHGGVKPDNFSINLLNPALCAQSFSKGDADIALVPAGALHILQDYKIITNYGIAADDEVRTVCLFSNIPIEQCNEVLLDDHSMTSVLLAKLLLNEVLLCSPKFSSANIGKSHISDQQAVLMIGDKVFDFESTFTFKYDLASIWKKWIGLPFVFAVWIAKKDLPDHIELQLENLFEYGINHLDEVIAENHSSSEVLKEYYSKYIRYKLDDSYKLGLKKYLQLTANLK